MTVWNVNVLITALVADTSGFREHLWKQWETKSEKRRIANGAHQEENGSSEIWDLSDREVSVLYLSDKSGSNHGCAFNGYRFTGLKDLPTFSQ